MNIDAKVVSRLDELIVTGEQVLATKRAPGRNGFGDSYVDSRMAFQWATSVQNLLVRVFGSDSEHYKNFTHQVEQHLTYSPTYRAQGILKSAQDDYVKGFVFDMRRLVEAEVLDDLLDQAQQLLESGYYAPAAVVAGCVLEDGLRKLCERSSIELTATPKLDSMNSSLAKAGVFSKLVQKRVTAFADVRNMAAHGEWAKFTVEDARDMLQGVRRLMETHFG